MVGAAWRARRPEVVLHAGLISLAAYLLTVSWWFWPWYVTWLVPLAALVLRSAAARLVLVWSLSALAAYVPSAFRPYFWGEPPDGRMPFWVAVTVFFPLAAAAGVFVWHKRLKHWKAGPTGRGAERDTIAVGDVP
jgi:hypothetical protein